MIKIASPLLALLLPGAALAEPTLPWIGQDALPALAACVLITLGALALAWCGLRRSAALDQHARTLSLQLDCERAARTQADQALAASQDVMCRLVREHEGVREGERTRIARELQAELGRRLLVLRSDLARLHLGAEASPALAGRLAAALANIDGAIGAVRMVAGGLRGFGPGDGLRHALERCLAEHAQLNGLRYRFEAGVDPAARAGSDRAARVAVFRVLQEVLAAGVQGDPNGEVSVRLREGAGSLGLEIGGCPTVRGSTFLPQDVDEQLRALGAVLRIADSGPDSGNGARHGRWSLSVPVRELADVA